MFSTGPKPVPPQILEYTIPRTGKQLRIELNTSKDGISQNITTNKGMFTLFNNGLRIEGTKKIAEKYYDAIINKNDYIRSEETGIGNINADTSFIVLTPRK